MDEMDEKKPETVKSFLQPQQQMEYSTFETSESGARLHTDSSGSEHVSSPEFTYDKEREVQSEPKWNDQLENAFDFPIYMDDFFDDAFPVQYSHSDHQLSSLQDMFLFMQKPF